MTTRTRSRRGNWKIAAAGVLLATAWSGNALAASIVGSKHDLTFNTAAKSSGTTEICVFCHTPHGANTAKGPLWNKGSPASTYTTYALTDTMDSPVLTPGSVSLACLTCHDGTQAMDNLINAPGTGGYNSTGARPTGWTWTGTAVNTTTGVMINGANMMDMLGTDLSDDHPIGVAYCGGFKVNACADGDFVITSLNRNAAGTVTSGTAAAVTSGAATDYWWIDTTGGTAGVREKGDIFLYTRAFTARSAVAGNYPSVECASCHNVHDPANGTFLRISNASSALCLACHTK